MDIIDNFMKNKKIIYFICFILAIYISFIQNRLTENQLRFFKNDYIRIIYLFVIIFIFNKNNVIGTLLLITYLTMSSSLVSEDFYVKENFYEYTPEQISNLLKEPHTICKDGRHKRVCSEINKNYKIIENSTKNILNTCNNLKNKKKEKKTNKNFINQNNKYDKFDLNKSFIQNNEFKNLLI